MPAEPKNPSVTPDPNKPADGEGTPTYLTQEEFDKKMAGFGTMTQEEKEQMFQFVDNMGTILNVIEADPALKSTIQERVKGNNGQPANNQTIPANQPNQNQVPNNNSQVPNGEIESIKGDVGSVVRSRRGEIIEGFEKQYGIASLPEDQKKEVRTKLGNKLLQWGHKIENIPVDHLKGLMEDAYITVAPEKLSDQGYVQGLLSARQGDSGSMPSMGGAGSVPNQSGEKGSLTGSQLDYVNKLGVDEGKAKETLKATT